MASWEFPGTDPIDLDISLTAGSIAVTAQPTEVAAVSLLPDQPSRAAEEAAANVRVSYSGGRLEIAEPKTGGLRRHHTSFSLTVRVPVGSRCVVRTAACDVCCEGELGALDVRTANGNVAAAVVTGQVQIYTASGDVRLDQAAAQVRVHTGSGDVWLRSAGGDVTAETASGDIEIGTAAASATARTASGNVRIGSLATGHAELTSVSGRIAVGVAPGVGVYLDLASLTGQVRSELGRSDTDGQAELDLRCRTVSGDLRVARAAVTSDASRA